jgi:hypothetical protein
MKAITKVIDAEIITRAIRALGHSPVSVPAHIPNGICMLPAKHGQLDHRLHTLAAQFGLTWELHTFGPEYVGLDQSYGYWILEV